MFCELELLADVEDDFALSVAEGGGDGAVVAVVVALVGGEVCPEAVFEDSEDFFVYVVAEVAAVATGLCYAFLGGHRNYELRVAPDVLRRACEPWLAACASWSWRAAACASSRFLRMACTSVVVR